MDASPELTDSHGAIDRFIDALWIEDGLAANSLAAYRRDLALYAQWLAKEPKKALDDPAVRKRIEETGSIVVGNTPQQFADQIKAEYEVYKKVVDSAKLKLD